MKNLSLIFVSFTLLFSETNAMPCIKYSDNNSISESTQNVKNIQKKEIRGILTETTSSLPLASSFSETNAMPCIKYSDKNSVSESTQNVKNIQKEEIRRILTETSPDKPPLLPESRLIPYSSVMLHVTSSMIIEFDVFSNKQLIIMKILLPSFRKNNFVSIREAAFSYLSLKAKTREVLSGMFIKKDSLLDSQMNIEEFATNAAESFGCNWYKIIEDRSMLPREFNKLFPVFFPRKSSLSYQSSKRNNS